MSFGHKEGEQVDGEQNEDADENENEQNERQVPDDLAALLAHNLFGELVGEIDQEQKIYDDVNGAGGHADVHPRGLHQAEEWDLECEGDEAEGVQELPEPEAVVDFGAQVAAGRHAQRQEREGREKYDHGEREAVHRCGSCEYGTVRTAEIIVVARQRGIDHLVLDTTHVGFVSGHKALWRNWCLKLK